MAGGETERVGRGFAAGVTSRGRDAQRGNEHVVITSLAPPGVGIQLDGHGAERLAMTFSGFTAAIT